MALLGDVLAWSETQPDWVRDALRRVFTNGDLAPADYEELIPLLLNANGAGIEGVPEAVPLAEHHLPGQPTTGTTCLTAITDIECVNRFAPGSSIAFAPTGMTIVFGHNGTGKTGVSRILKQVCRARVRQPVLGNVFADDFAQQVPRAVIHFQHEGADDSFNWEMGGNAPSELQSIAIMDEACAHDYVANVGHAAFQPFGLGHLQDLADKVFAELARRVQRSNAGLDCDAARFERIANPSTQVGRLLARITANTDTAAVERLGSLSDADTARIGELTTLLAESNGEARAVGLEAYAGRLDEVLRQATRARSYVDDRAVGRWKNLLEERDTTAKARDDIQALIRGDHLPGTGGEHWRLMFNSAKEFSLRQAYPEQPAPYLGEGAQCPLCQTDLDAASKARLAAFNNFIVSDAAVAAAGAETTLATARTAIRDADLGLPVDEVLTGEITANNPLLLEILAAARVELSDRRAWMLERERNRTWEDAPALTHEPSHFSLIHLAVGRLRHQAGEFRAAVDEVMRARLEAERQELLARQALAPHKDAVLTVISNLKQRDLLGRCAAALDTTPISRQCRTLATRYITDALIADMTAELRNLRVEGMTSSLRPRIDRGRILVSLVVEGTTVKAASILSDGEKRIAAIAHFLAELSQSGSTSGVVVDDPVSSLDHRYRHRVAKRFVKESMSRQVVVFTHDAVFLSALLTELERLELRPEVLSMETSQGSPGQAVRGLPWNNQSVGEKLDKLDADHRRLAEQWAAPPSDALCREMADTYSRVRGTLERLIRENIFGKAIRPFDDRVQIERVAVVAGFSTPEFTQINEIYLRCNAATDAHDSTAEGGKEIPHPDDLQADIATMRGLVAQAAERARVVRRASEAAAAVNRRD